MHTRIVDANRLLEELVATMCLWDGNDIAEKATEILGHPVTYKDDSMFEIQED